MKNLKSPEKRLISSSIIALASICFGVFLYLYFKPTPEIPDHSIQYQYTIDSLNKVIEDTQSVINTLQVKIDSLQGRKITIINNYHEEVNVIRDASAAEHARWFESVIRELEDYRGF